MEPRSRYAKCFQPLESDPDVFNALVHALGAPKTAHFSDVVSLDSSMLDFVPRPVIAVILAFPESKQDEVVKKRTDNTGLATVAADVIWLPQTIDNACGMYAAIHAFGNSSAQKSLREFDESLTQ